MNLDLRFVESLDGVDEAEWQALPGTAQPFCSYAFLRAMETSGSLATDKGWTASHALLFVNGKLAAAVPSYIKTNSHGEFVYDWAWADAYDHCGVPYYPKFLSGIPYSPVCGPRVLVSPDAAKKDIRQSVINGLAGHCEEQKYSSWHINFLADNELQLFRESNHNFLYRYNWQFHWPNRGYATFGDFLSTLKRRKRNNIRRERKRVADAGITIKCLHGNELDDENLAFVIKCYRDTFLMKGNYPALTDDFFYQLKNNLTQQFLVTLAFRAGQPVAAAIFLRDDEKLYGRYWGAMETIPDLHFELCYYQGIEYCIEHGIKTFQPGAGGEYKISRGFLPVKTHSAHLIRQPEFHNAIREFLREEDRWLKHYHHDVMAHSPYQELMQVADTDDPATS
jgi:predicted N-acyltransferase